VSTPSTSRLRLVVLLSVITIVSQFHRSSLSVIAPELVRDLSLTPQMLGLAGGAFFLALAVAQIPIGVLLDWMGPRRLVAALTVLAVIGSLACAAADSGTTLVLARLLVGLGCGAYFMGAVLMCSRWFTGARLASALSWVFALSQIGNLLASSPLAAASESIGWRWAFVLAAAGTAAAGIAFWTLVRSDHPAPVPAPAAPPTLRQTLRGLPEVLRTPGLPNVLAVHTFVYACVATVLGLWAGPYLHDVHRMDALARGHVLAAMTLAQFFGMLAFGPLDAWFNTRKWIVVTGGTATVAVLAALALIPAPPTGLAVGLLIALCGITSYAVTVVAHGRSLFPDRLLGRGMTTLNLAQVLGAGAMPLVTGAVAAALSGPGVAGSVAAGDTFPPHAYRAIFAVMGALLAAGLAVYARGPDARPRPAASGRRQ